MKRPGAFRFYLTAGACLLLLPLKMIEGWNTEPAFPLFSSWVADGCLLFWVCWLGVAAGGSRPTRKLLAGGLVFLALELPVLFTITAHSYFLEEATARQFSLLDISPGAVGFFLREVVPPAVLWSGAAIFLGLAAAAFLLGRRLPAPPRKPAVLAISALSVLVLVHQGFCRFYPSVLWEVGRDVAEACSHPAVQGPRFSAELSDAGVGRPADWSGTDAFDKVMVFVMESVPWRELQERMHELPPDHFFRRHMGHAHVYLNYFATNQDSRTGLLAMLFGRLIPFEAYTERDARRYLFLKNERSLVNIMSGRGYSTAVAAAETDEELVVFELPWGKKLLLSQAEFENHGPFLCFNPYKFEHDCEDKILLPRILGELAAHKRAFVFQEGVFGHIGDYSDATGKSSTEYYGEHLQAVMDGLEARGELDRTLLVVTSDHGIRDWEYRQRRWVYRLPLIFINPGFSHREETGLYNQGDFPALLAAQLSGHPPPAPRRLSLFVGCTNSSIIGGVTAENDLLVVKNRKWRKYVLADGNCSGDDLPDSPARHRVSGAAIVDFFERLQYGFTVENFSRGSGGK
ncbi:MAG: sulfatase-like hydrolase/transferase [Deltaproteobacteria bacterium]|nr:sulfatase-like hydrolase/transferase [Deltaproteobacteria bacterium]